MVRHVFSTARISAHRCVVLMLYFRVSVERIQLQEKNSDLEAQREEIHTQFEQHRQEVQAQIKQFQEQVTELSLCVFEQKDMSCI